MMSNVVVMFNGNLSTQRVRPNALFTDAAVVKPLIPSVRSSAKHAWHYLEMGGHSLYEMELFEG